MKSQQDNKNADAPQPGVNYVELFISFAAAPLELTETIPASLMSRSFSGNGSLTFILNGSLIPSGQHEDHAPHR